MIFQPKIYIDFVFLFLLMTSLVCNAQCKFSVIFHLQPDRKIHKNEHFAMYANFPMNDDKINPDQFPEDANSQILNCDYNM